MRRGALLVSTTPFESEREKVGALRDDTHITAPHPRNGSRPCAGSSSSVNSAASVTLSCLCALLRPPRGEAWAGHGVAKGWRNPGTLQQPPLQRESSAPWPCRVRQCHGSSESVGGFSRRRKRGLTGIVDSHVSMSTIADTGSNHINNSRSDNSNDNAATTTSSNNRLDVGAAAGPPSSPPSPTRGETPRSQPPPRTPQLPPPNTAVLNGRRRRANSTASSNRAPPLRLGVKPAADRTSQGAVPRGAAALTASSANGSDGSDESKSKNDPAGSTLRSPATPSRQQQQQPADGKGKSSHALEHEMRRLGKKRRWKDVLEVLRSIEIPSVGHYLAAIAACDLAGEPKQALRVHGLMVESGAKPSPVRNGSGGRGGGGCEGGRRRNGGKARPVSLGNGRTAQTNAKGGCFVVCCR